MVCLMTTPMMIMMEMTIEMIKEMVRLNQCSSEGNDSAQLMLGSRGQLIKNRGQLIKLGVN